MRTTIDAPEYGDFPPASGSPTSGSGEKLLWNQMLWTPITANENVQGGAAYELTCGGILSSRSTSPGTLQVVLRYGTDTTTSTNNKSSGASTAVTLTASLVNVPWYAKATFYYRTGDPNNATCAANGVFVLGNLTTTAANVRSFGSNNITACDFTTTRGLYLATNFSQATTSTATAQWFWLRRLN